MIRLFLIIALLLPSFAGSDGATPEQLKQLRDRIQALQKTLADDLRSRDRIQTELRRTETRIGALAREGRTLLVRQQEAARQLQDLQQQQADLLEEQARQLDWLARTARASYMTGREPVTKLLLNQQQPDQIARLLRYQAYFQEARSERLVVIDHDMARLQQVRLEVMAAEQRLSQRRAEVGAQAERLADARQERQRALADVLKQLDAREQEIGRLQQDEARLDRLLQDMNRALSDIPADPRGTAFNNLAGQLPWPVPGTPRVRFGAEKEGGMRWNGVMLDARDGAPIRAVHAGRVVFADWLRGYGLMLIVDHSDGFLTLYGHAQSLLRDVGDWVGTGDVLALAGDSGGQQRSGVYFEIRRQGKPVNPDRWCSHRVTLPPLAEFR